MGYMNALQKLALPQLGAGARPGANATPAAQPHIEPAPYDVAHDPGWTGVIDPNDHAVRNFLNGLTPEERMLVLKLAQKGVPGLQPGPGAGPPGGAPPPPGPMGAMGGGPPAPPAAPMGAPPVGAM
jgi:hypothetical protein